MAKFECFTKMLNGTCGYDMLLTVCLNDKKIFEKVYYFDHEADTWEVELLAKDMIKLMEDIENGKV